MQAIYPSMMRRPLLRNACTLPSVWELLEYSLLHIPTLYPCVDGWMASRIMELERIWDTVTRPEMREEPQKNILVNWSSYFNTQAFSEDMTVSSKSGSNSPDVLSAENTAFLSLLHEVPVTPSAQPLTDLGVRAGQGTRTLSIDRELLIENHKDDRLDVLVAVNRAKERDQGPEYAVFPHDSQLPSLQPVGNEPHIEAEVFTAVVTVSYERIVARLRFVKPTKDQKGHPKGRAKASLRDSLQKAWNAVQSSRQPLQIAGLQQTAEAFLEASKLMLTSLQSFENHRTISGLESLIDEALHWSQPSEFEQLFIALPNSVMDRQTFTALRRNLRKIAQYRIASRDLYRTARKYPILRRALVSQINLGAKAFARQTPAQYQPELDRTLKRILPNHSQISGLARLAGYLKKGKDELRDDFKVKVGRILRESRIHAEVQILAYLEDKCPPLPPRVIRSSKKACFLCNSLFGLQKTYSIPHSHGRLYEGWRVPRMPCLHGLHQRLNHALQLQARNSIQFLFQQRRPIGYPAPYESSAFALSRSETTVNINTIEGRSVDRAVQPAVDTAVEPVSEESTEDTEAKDAKIDADAEAEAEKESSSSQSEVQLPSTLPEPPDYKQSFVLSGENSSVAVVESTSSDSEPLPWREVPLEQGCIYSHKLSSGGESCVYTLGKQLEICVEHFNTSASLRSPHKPLMYEIKWLNPEQAHNLRQHRAVALVDPRALSPGEDTNVSDQKPIYIGKKKETKGKRNYRPVDRTPFLHAHLFMETRVVVFVWLSSEATRATSPALMDIDASLALSIPDIANTEIDNNSTASRRMIQVD
ncbi:hypothetical protein ACRALDRAFT_1091729 [Sodiomyces alcalophilus JCM 7366]|uniref:uncharacterized protein n=1 Tax=Sodiomyces alcalophilus JCM 7366 TaxID=591952 RepID=UPI0039B3A170